MSTSMATAAVISSILSGCGADDSARDLQGRWDGPGRATISLKANGIAEGNDGCNDVAANWEPISETSGKFVVSETSDMGCIDAIGWQDAARYVVKNRTLVIESDDGKALTELVRPD